MQRLLPPINSTVCAYYLDRLDTARGAPGFQSLDDMALCSDQVVELTTWSDVTALMPLDLEVGAHVPPGMRSGLPSG